MSDSTRATSLRWLTALLQRLGKSPLALLFVSAFVLTRPLIPSEMVDGNLDPSWNGVILYAADKGWDFGADIVYTYGPLGYLVSPYYLEETFFFQTIAILLLHAIGAALLATAVRNQTTTWRVIGAIAMLAMPLGVDVLLPVYLAAGFVVALQSGKTSVRVAFVAFASVLSLIKFTLFLGSVVAVGALTLEQLRRYPWRFAIPFSVGLSILFLLGTWTLVAKQPLLNFFGWLTGSWDVASNFNKTMHLPNPGELMGAAAWMAVLAVATAICLLGGDLKRILPPASRKNLWEWMTSRSVASTGVFVFFVFVAWKHGFTRSDGHVTIFFSSASVLVSLFAGAFLSSRAALVFLLAALGIGQVAKVATYEQFAGEDIRVDGPFEINQRIASRNLRSLHRLEEVRDEKESEWRAARKELALPRIEEAVGRDTIDFLGDRQGYALANSFRLKSRPMFQAFSAYSPSLCARNALFYATEEAPDWVAVELAPIDGRFPFSADGPAFIQVLQRYDLALFESPFLLYQRREIPEAIEFLDLPEVDAMLGETILVPTVPEGKWLWAEIDLKPTLSGKIGSLLAQPSAIELKIEEANHPLGSKSYRLPAPLAASGILLHPFLRDTADVSLLGSGKAPTSIQRFSIHVGSGFHAEVKIRFRTIGLRPQYRMDENELWEAGLGVPLDGIESAVPPRWQEMKGEVGLCVQAPGRIEVPVPVGSNRLRGRFGVDRDAYRDDESATGTITFAARADGETLWESTIDPIEKKSQRAWQVFEFQLPAETKTMMLEVQGDGQEWQQGL
ncbi:MAG: hypothetical protein AAGA58_08075 [Verrucomicrobiota bacterium]